MTFRGPHGRAPLAEWGREAAPAPRPRCREAEIYVYPGRVVASASGHLLRTVLGSCVSVCLFDPRLRVGGMNHYLLADAAGSEGGSARFSGPAIQRLIGQLLGLGAHQGHLVAKVFGGSGSGGGDRPATGLQVGRGNVAAARRILSDEGIPVVAEDVGGPRGRRLLFDTAEGGALVTLI